MRNPPLQSLAAIVLFVLSLSRVNAQSTGYINREATNVTGKAVLDPNGDRHTSATTAGYGSSDVVNSELPYRAVPSFSIEPFGDLRRGPNHLYSDFVPDAGDDGYYTYFNGTNMFFRFRMGSVMSGSKGYSVLLDTDGKFGATGTNADPNYQAETTGTNGNPGFEIEIVLETNFRIAIYNVDGTSSPALIKAYTNWQDMSQVSIAGTFDNGDPDFFMDFYIPFADLQGSPFSLTTTSPIRMSATTVMSPQAAIGGPKSDIYGLTDAGYKTAGEQYEAYINAQPSFTPSNLTSGSIGAICTSAPIVNGPISTGTVNISGTWTKSNLTGAGNTATITIYKNGSTVLGIISNVSSGATWTLNGVSTISSDVITAKAQAAGESMCLTSNAIVAQSCNPSNIPSNSGLTISNATTRGLEGVFVTGNEVKVYFINPTTLATSILAGPTANSPTFGYSGTAWYYNGSSYNGNNVVQASSGGSPDLSNGMYYVTTNSSGATCESAPVFACVGLGTTTATPTITQTVLYNTNTQVSGTATAGAQVRLRVNGQLIGTTTATGGNYSFTGLKLMTGDVVDVRAVATNSCMSASASLTVTCYTKPPLINADANNQMTAGQPVTGISSEPAGTTIRVYTSANALVSTVTVQSGGTWTTGSYIAVAGTSYYATAQNGGCRVSSASGTIAAAAATSGRCGTITGPVTSSAASVSGTLNGSIASTTVNLYLDGILIGGTTTSGTAWGPISVNTTVNNALYPTGTLTIGVKETGKQEQFCSASAATIRCSSGPVAPNVNPTNATLTQGQTQTYTIDNAVVGAFYGLADATTGQSLGTGKWASSSTVSLTTNSFSTGTYDVVVKATSLSGVSVCSSSPSIARVMVSGVLPVTLSDFNGKKYNERVQLAWITENEYNVSHYEVERSSDGISFNKIAEEKSLNTQAKRTYSVADEHPLALNYYRLKMIDVDGKFTYSNVIAISHSQSLSFVVQPNPFVHFFSVTVDLTTSQILQAKLLDLNGRLIFSKTIMAVQGKNKIAFDEASKLKPGVYLISIEGNGISFQKKVIKAEK